MLGKKHLFMCGILFIAILCSLYPVSLAVEREIIDPFSSEALLSQRTFFPGLSEEELASGKNFKVELVTMGKGDPLYVWFGHSALVVTDLVSGRSVMYDYGIFSFDEGFYQTFAMGRLYYQVWATDAKARYELAIEENRDISTIELLLPAESKIELIRFLNFNIRDDQKTYLYHHYNENCATRIRDIIDKAVDGQFKAWAQSMPATYTLREHVTRHTSPSFFIDWSLNFLQSGAIDHSITRWDEMFLPLVLQTSIEEFSYIDPTGVTQKLATNQKILHRAPTDLRIAVLESYHSNTLRYLLFGIVAGVCSLILLRGMYAPTMSGIKRLSRILYGIYSVLWTSALGILATVLLFMVLISNHDVTYGNENLVIAHPYLLVMAIQGWFIVWKKTFPIETFRKGSTFFLVSSALLIIVKLIFPDFLIQQNWNIIWTLFPLYLCNSTIPFEKLFPKKKRIIDNSDF